MDEKTINTEETTASEVTSSNNDELFTEDDKKAIRYLNMGAQISDIHSMIDAFKENDKAMMGMLTGKSHDDFNPDEFSEYLEKALESFSSEDIKKMSDDQINQLYSFNGQTVDVDLDISPQKMVEFKRDYLVFRKRYEEETVLFNEEIAKIEAEINESREEFDAVVNKYSNVSAILEERLLTAYENATDPDKKYEYGEMYKYLRYAYNLDILKDFMRSYRGKDVLPAYHDEKQSNKVFDRYKAVCQRLGVKSELNKFPGLEAKFLGEEYNERENIFLFSVMYLISTWYSKPINNKFATLFISQFNINIKNLVYDKFASEKEKDDFIGNIKEVINIRY